MKTVKQQSDLGYRNSLGESYEDIVKSNNSQEKQDNRCILQLFKYGNSKLETVKIIKDKLHIGLMEAKQLVDSCPTDIDLSQYPIERSKYKILFDTLNKNGCVCSLKLKEQ